MFSEPDPALTIETDPPPELLSTIGASRMSRPEKSKTSRALRRARSDPSVTVPGPKLPASPLKSPSSTVTPPVRVLSPVRRSVALPSFTSEPAPVTSTLSR